MSAQNQRYAFLQINCSLSIRLFSNHNNNNNYYYYNYYYYNIYNNNYYYNYYNYNNIYHVDFKSCRTRKTRFAVRIVKKMAPK